VFDYGNTDDGLLYLAMELLKGRTLGKVIKFEGPLAAGRVARIGIQVCKSLNEAHGHGIVHRDLKPENIFLTDVAGEDELVKVLDFGIAKVVTSDTGESSITRTGMVVGTPAYMAPEQGTGKPVTPATDLYSLGVILYECLSGRQPFSGETPLAVLMKHASEPVPRLVVGSMPPDVPPEMEDLVYQLLAKDPSRRPASAIDVAHLLEATLDTLRGITPQRAAPAQDVVVPPPGPASGTLVDGAPASRPPAEVPDGTTVAIDARPQATAARPAVEPRAGETRADTGSAEFLKPAGGRKWLWPALIVVVLAGGAGGAWFALAGGETVEPAPAVASAPAQTPRATARPEPAPASPKPAPLPVNAVPAPAPTPAPQPESKTLDKPKVVAQAKAPAKEPAPALPACSALKCPFTKDCHDPRARRVKGEEYCFPKF